MILVIDSEGRRLCRDNCWREFANFGSDSCCVKEYKKIGYAKKKAQLIKGKVVSIPKGMTVDASGNLYADVGRVNTLKEYADSN